MSLASLPLVDAQMLSAHLFRGLLHEARPLQLRNRLSLKLQEEQEASTFQTKTNFKVTPRPVYGFLRRVQVQRAKMCPKKHPLWRLNDS